MRVCGLTVINTPNYGTVLQAFALQETVKALGHQYTVLNYLAKEQEVKFSFWGSSPYMDWKYKIAKKVLYPFRKYQLNQILRFQHSHLQLSERLVTKDELKQMEGKHDIFITGSDQVWNNQEINHFDDAFFLAFVSQKRTIAYAASFGKTYSMLTNDDLTFYKGKMPCVDRISVREKTGIEIVKKTIGEKATWVCDPCFLLTKEQWDNYCVTPRCKGYILVYLVGDGINFDINRCIVKRAKKVGKEKGLSVIVVGVGLSSVLYGSFITPKVEEWLGLIKNCKLLLTNSFHGTVFATIFGVPFYSVVSGDANNRMNTRLYDLLQYLGLEDRLVDSEEFEVAIPNYTAPSEEYREKINRFKSESIKFLTEAIEG